MIDLCPKRCNICGGEVVYTSNASIYGRKYGSGYCYLCMQCGAYVGTHKPWPKRALGILANKEMRDLKMQCHEIFDSFWRGKPKAGKKRHDLYCWLAKEMNIPVEECHFGYFDQQQLEKALELLESVKSLSMQYDNCGRLFFG